jgi:hypothetical protein
MVYNAKEHVDSKFDDVADILSEKENVCIKVRVITYISFSFPQLFNYFMPVYCNLAGYKCVIWVERLLFIH